MHWPDNKGATDWTSLLVEVRRWPAAAQLRWSDDDNAEVRRHLDQHYRLEQPVGTV